MGPGQNLGRLVLERVPKRGALVTSVKVGFDHRRRWYQRLELVGYRAVRRPDRPTRGVRVSRLCELRPVADHRIGKLLLRGRKWCHRQVEKLASELGIEALQYDMRPTETLTAP